MTVLDTGERVMQIADVGLRIPELKIVRFARFLDDRGYFAEVQA